MKLGRREIDMEEKPWFEQYDQGVPHSLRPYPQRTLLDIVSTTTKQRPDHIAMIFKGARIAYSELERLSDAFSAALVALGVKKGDRVALLLPNCPQFVIAQLGIWKASAIAVPINPLYTEDELVHMLNECGAETAVVLSRFYTKVQGLHSHNGSGRTNLKRVIATNIKVFFPPLLRFLFTILMERKEGYRAVLRSEDLWMEDLLNQYAGAPKLNIKVDPEDPALLLFTGGTTGTPKAALTTHAGLLATGMQLNAWFGEILIDWEDTIMLNMPLFHVYGNVGILATGLVGRNPLVLIPNPRDLDDLVATIRKVRPAFLPGVPTLFNALPNHPDVTSGKVDFKSIKLCISGASPLLLETKNRFEALTGGKMVEAYGLTESFLAAIIGPIYGHYKPGAVGLPLPDVEVRFADAVTGENSLPPGEIGELLIRAPQVMECYWERPAETADIVRDGWLYTGDLGYMDEEGFVFIVDRKKDLIKPSGFQVWPREVEEVIASHPAVDEVGVAGVPNPYQGEAVRAWVVLGKGHQLTVDELRAYCKKKLAAYKVPKHVEFRDSLPMSHLGKLLRRELAAEEE